MIALGSDHGGYLLKEAVRKHLEEKGIEYKDFGCFSEESCDYAFVADTVGRAVVAKKYDKGILICGTGIGISISANKVKGVRAAVCTDTFTARMTRLHNDANILCMGGRVIGAGLALDIVDIFLTTEFEGGRHKRRIDQIAAIEENRLK